MRLFLSARSPQFIHATYVGTKLKSQVHSSQRPRINSVEEDAEELVILESFDADKGKFDNRQR